MRNDKTIVKGKKHLDYVDYAKGIGILLVVLGHTNLIIDGKDKAGDFLIHFIYSFHMPLFFVITGLLLGFQGRKLEKLDKIPTLKVGKLFKRLMVPYYIWSLVYMAAEFLQHGNQNERIQGMLRATIITSGNAPLWFLATLFCTRILFHLLKNRLFLTDKEILIGSLFLSFFASKSYILMTDKGWMDPQLLRFFTIALFRIFPSLFFVSFGYFLSGQLGRKDKQRDLCIGITSMLILLISVALYFPGVNMHIFKLNDMLYFLLTGITGSVGMLHLCRCMPDNIKPLRELGLDSMDIMALHYDPLPFMYIAADIVLKFTGGKNIILVWIICCVMVIPLTLVLKYIKKAAALPFQPKEKQPAR